MSRTFTITENKCYFCNAKETILFNEHYRFCPECSAIYTNMLVLEIQCIHLNIRSPFVTRDCWYVKERRAKAYIKPGHDGAQICSWCGTECYADGW